MIPSTAMPFDAAQRAVDRLVLSYIILVGLLFLALGQGTQRWLMPLVHLALIVLIAVILRLWGDQTTGARGFVRLLYAPLLFTFFYEEMGGAIDLVFPHFFDAGLVAFEKGILGFHPTLALQPYQVTWLNEWIMLGYFSYYLLIPVAALPLFFRGNIDALVRLVFTCAVAFFLSYLGFVLYPIEGPRFHFAALYDAPLSGWVFVPLVNFVIGTAALHGGCMPSSHVAVSLVVWVLARRAMPRLGRFLTPLILTLWVGTVWGRYHYVSDVVVGLLVGAAAIWFADRRLGIATTRAQTVQSRVPEQAPVMPAEAACARPTPDAGV